MSDGQHKIVFSHNAHAQLALCLFVKDSNLRENLKELLSDDRYVLHLPQSGSEFLNLIIHEKEQIDCLLIQDSADLLRYVRQLHNQNILLPLLIISRDSFNTPIDPDPPNYLYHSGELHVPVHQVKQINSFIDHAITQFLNIQINDPIPEPTNTPSKHQPFPISPKALLSQQQRLAEKLKERLGYLGVYYKRNPQYFYRNLSEESKQELIEQLSEEYRQIILDYFSGNEQTNALIDQFVNRAFFADLSVSQVLEIHMDLMDEFAQQLKLEGRNEEILLDYRLTLIDLIAHLCEMYRRSIPREDLPFELLFRID